MPPDPVPEYRRITDPRALRAMAHPLRLSIIEQLTLNGALTASQLGVRLGESAANCSWHLRKLAEHGFVEDAGSGEGRARPWQVTHIGMSWDEVGQPAEAYTAGEALSRVLVEREVARFADSRARLRDDSPIWQEAADSHESMLWLTAAELAEINAEVRALFTRHFERHTDAAARPEGSRLCAFMQWGVPAYGLDGANG